MSEDILVAKKTGSITITVYQEPQTGGFLFELDPDSKKLLPIVDFLESTLQKI